MIASSNWKKESCVVGRTKYLIHYFDSLKVVLIENKFELLSGSKNIVRGPGNLNECQSARCFVFYILSHVFQFSTDVLKKEGGGR